MHPVSCTSIYHDVTDLVNQARVENRKEKLEYLDNET